MRLRVGGVDAVDLGRLEHDLDAHLHAAQRRRGIGGEKRIAGAGGENHDLALFQVAHRLAADVGLDHLLDVERRLHAARRFTRRIASCSASAFITVASMPM